MSVKTKPFNTFDDLIKDDETALELLEETLNNEDPAVFITLLGQYAKHKGMANIAAETGMNRESLYKALGGSRSPRWDTVSKVLRALDVKLKLA